ALTCGYIEHLAYFQYAVWIAPNGARLAAMDRGIHPEGCVGTEESRTIVLSMVRRTRSPGAVCSDFSGFAVLVGEAVAQWAGPGLARHRALSTASAEPRDTAIRPWRRTWP